MIQFCICLTTTCIVLSDSVYALEVSVANVALCQAVNFAMCMNAISHI